MVDVQVGLEPTGAALFESQLEVIERVTSFVCSRYHLTAADAEDFSSHVKLRLIEHDYAILRKFEGRSSPRTYLTIVIQRVFLDYRISAWGKWRPSAEARRGGHVAVLLEQLLARDGYTFEEACELLVTNHGVRADRAELERLAARLPVRVKRRFEPDEALADVAAPDAPVDDVLAERDRAATAVRVEQVLKSAMAALEPQDRLILALRFEDGRSVAEIASLLRLDQKGLYRRVERLLKSLRNALQAQHIDSTSVLEMMESPAVSIDWRAEDGEIVNASPSRGPGAQRGAGR
jgi:RNA polymerase sigma factor for flagellar operon FliA